MSYYADDTVTVHHGDCLDVLATLPDGSVDAVVTDPPYNLSFMAKPWDAYEGREDAGFAYWLSGLIDGEGHFSIKAHARGTHAPAFALKMRADERGTLERIKRSLGVGTIADEKREPNPMVKYVIQDKAGCQRLVDLLDKYPLRAKKQVDYWSWRDAVCEWTSRPRGNRWHGRADNSKMASLRNRLMENRAYTDIPWSGDEFQDWCRLWATECLRVLKPGGHLLAFGGTRTSHRLACAIEDAGFEIRDSIAWLYGSGFPKSLDVSKAIDKAAGAEREVLSETFHRAQSSSGGILNRVEVPRIIRETEPASDAARTWQGWGTALKPAHEPIVVARKPLVGTVAGNVLEWGCGALNIDAARVQADGGSGHSISRETTPRGCRVHDVRPLRDADGTLEIPGGPGEVADDVRSRVPERPDARSEQPQLDRRYLDRGAEWVSTGRGGAPVAGGSRAIADASSEGISRTPAGDGAQDRQAAAGDRDGPSHQRREGGQPAGEPALDRLAGPLPRASADRAGDGEPSSGERTSPLCTCGERDTPALTPAGRWPANVVLDESQAAALDTQSGESVSTNRPRHNTAEAHNRTASMGGTNTDWTTGGHDDSGGASRFFYTAKADAAERVRLPKPGAGEGRVTGLGGKVRECNVCGTRAINSGATELTCGHHDHRWVDNPRPEYVAHPTFNPLALMRWLVRLVTPPGGVVLEPFAGSGTTVEACILEGFKCIAIEREADYLPLITQRIHRRRDPVAAVLATGEDGGLFDLLGEEPA